MRNGVLFVGGHLGERLRIAVGDEQRVVAEPLVPGLAVDDPPLDDAFEKVLLAAENQRDDRAETRPAVLCAFEVFVAT